MRVELLSHNLVTLERWETILRKFEPVAVDRIEKSGEARIVVADYDSAGVEIRSYLQDGIDSMTRPVVLEGVPDVERGKSLLAAGVKGYGNSYMSSMWLKTCIETVMNGNVWLYPEFVNALVVELTGDRRQQTLPDFLTPRQKELIELLLEGFSNKEIAERLGIKERTVKAHLANIYEKFGVSNRFELAVRLQNG